MSIRKRLGRLKRGAVNWLAEQRGGSDERFAYDLRDLEDCMRVSYCSLREVGFQTRCMISERVIEYALVFQKIARLKSRVLDIGSSESFLPYQLATLGHSVVASDLFPARQLWRKSRLRGHWTVAVDWGGYPLRHPNLRFVREDATRLGHGDGQFDFVTAISTVEHIGCYGTRVADPTRPGKHAMREMRRVLKPGGKLLVSVPYGTGGDSPRNWLLQLIFNDALLDQYLDGFQIVERRYFTHQGTDWEECDRGEAEIMDCSTRTTGVCFVEAQKA